MTRFVCPTPDLKSDHCAEVNALLVVTSERLRAVLDDEAFAEETPIEVSTAMELAIEAIEIVLEKLKAVPICEFTASHGS